MNDTVVIFSDDGARILSGVDGKLYSLNSNALVNPVIPRRIAPHKWKLVDGKIAIQDDKEIQRRENLLNPIILDKTVIYKPKINKLLLISLGLNIVLIVLHVVHFIK
jgi:hypothetical protein